MCREMEKRKEKSELDKEMANKLKEVFDKNTAVMSFNGREINDNESMHIDADKLIIEFLEQLGYTETVEQYKEMEKHFWYA